MDNHKLYELTVNEDDIRFHHANPNPLSAGQKYNITMAVIVCVAAITIVLAFFSLLH